MNKQAHPSEKKRHIVVVGGGFGGIELIKRLRKSPFEITLIDKHNYHTFQPLLYQVATGGLGADAIGYPFRLIFRNQKNFRFRMAEVQEIQHEQKILKTSSGDVAYDDLIIATGSTSNYFGNASIETFGMPMKSIPDALNLRSDVLQEFEKASITNDPILRQALMTFVVVGGGPTGVETAGALAEFKRYVLPHDYPGLNPEEMQVFLIEAGPRLLVGMSEESSNKAKRYLTEMGVNVVLNVAVKDYDGHTAHLANDISIKTQTLIWSAGVKGMLFNGIPKDSILGGRIKVDDFLRVEGMQDVYAIGDVALHQSKEYPRGHPMVAPVAVQQGNFIAKNLTSVSKNKKSLKGFKYKDKGSMATVGRNKAVVDLSFYKFGGFFAWLIWMFLHLMLLVGFRNRLVVFIDWMWNYFSYERALRLIVREYKSPSASFVKD